MAFVVFDLQSIRGMHPRLTRPFHAAPALPPPGRAVEIRAMDPLRLPVKRSRWRTTVWSAQAAGVVEQTHYPNRRNCFPGKTEETNAPSLD